MKHSVGDEVTLKNPTASSTYQYAFTGEVVETTATGYVVRDQDDEHFAVDASEIEGAADMTYESFFEEAKRLEAAGVDVLALVKGVVVATEELSGPDSPDRCVVCKSPRIDVIKSDGHLAVNCHSCGLKLFGSPAPTLNDGEQVECGGVNTGEHNKC